jgi:hypothetical protein
MEGQDARAGDQWTVPEMWLPAGVGFNSRETPYSSNLITGFLLIFSLSTMYKTWETGHTPGQLYHPNPVCESLALSVLNPLDRQ